MQQNTLVHSQDLTNQLDALGDVGSNGILFENNEKEGIQQHKIHTEVPRKVSLFQEYIHHANLRGWYFVKIEGMRPGRSVLSTYELFSLESLPPLDFNNDYRLFLSKYELNGNHDESIEAAIESTEELPTLTFKDLQLDPSSVDLDVDFEKIPYSVLQLFQKENSKMLSKSLISPTGCYFQLSKAIGPLNLYSDSEVFLVPFFKDEYGVLTWYALFDRSLPDDQVGSFSKPVVVSGIPSCSDILNINLRDFDIVSLHVEEFVWRTFIEGFIWKELHKSHDKSVKELHNCHLRLYGIQCTIFQHRSKIVKESEQRQREQQLTNLDDTDIDIVTKR
ncbi:hypothetical protein C9374_007437 [Naegleria lovaniensis]|uniref:Uncharacterized protein n=1 Tax=Naegleria lovaniensis TaxID=51637 RepID=A0AA88GN22_NAELO|nr:uncharacterized protein C9374_007437 [Naegleria lovaniensis]KAG2379298.1 hypothetical protein C9374_007437 [Naegleria lovaniensis]